MTTARIYEPTGCKALGTSSTREMLQVERRVQVIRNRMERWLHRTYRRLLSELRESLVSLTEDGTRIPEDHEIRLVIEWFRHRQEVVLRRYYSELFPKIEALVLPDDTIKSWMSGREVKAREDFQRAMDEWIQTLMGINITYISDDTLNAVRALFRTSGNDPVLFMDALEGSWLFGSVRARRIAITETTSGINSAMHTASERVAQNRRRVKIWRTTGRHNVRSNHMRMNGKTVDADELFKVPRKDGGFDLMMYPGDSAHGASAENIVNCHCMVFYKYAKEES